MQLQITKPYIALSIKTCINIREQGLATCKKISCKFYCEENPDIAVKAQLI